MSLEDLQALQQLDSERHSTHRSSMSLEEHQHMREVNTLQHNIRRQLIRDESRVLSVVTDELLDREEATRQRDMRRN
jgi:hypothetical protein